MSTLPWPTEIRVRKSARTLEIAFDDGARFTLPAEYLRVMTGSAIDRGHGAGPRKPLAGKAAVALLDAQPIGGYALRLVFDDGHDTGLYSFEELYRLGRDQDRVWGDYLRDLESAGLPRTA
jgi:DUF971 family protein